MRKLLLLFVLVFYFAFSFCQNNLVRNSGFEDGTLNSGAFNENVYYWHMATTENGSYITPIWADFSIPHSDPYTDIYEEIRGRGCSWYYTYPYKPTNGSGYGSPDPYSSNRFVIISQYGANGYIETDGEYDDNKNTAIYTTLTEPLQPGNTYVLRMKINPYSMRVFENTTGINYLRVFFSNGNKDNWYEALNFEAYNANVIIDTRIQDNAHSPCVWQQIERRFIPPFGATSLILYAQEGNMGIDDVELYEACQEDVFIENKVLESNIFYHYNEGYPRLYESSDQLEAQNVIVESGADVVFEAANSVKLKTGFHAKAGCHFKASIAPCNNTYGRFASDSVRYNSQVQTANELPNSIGTSKGEKGIDLVISETENPAQYQITTGQSGSLMLYNMLGEKLLQRELQSYQSETIDLSSFPKGVYVARFYSGDKVEVRKIVGR